MIKIYCLSIKASIHFFIIEIFGANLALAWLITWNDKENIVYLSKLLYTSLSLIHLEQIWLWLDWSPEMIKKYCLSIKASLYFFIIETFGANLALAWLITWNDKENIVYRSKLLYISLSLKDLKQIWLWLDWSPETIKKILFIDQSFYTLLYHWNIWSKSGFGLADDLKR